MSKIEYEIIGQNSEVPYDAGEYVCNLGIETKSYQKVWGIQVVKREAHLRKVQDDYVLVIRFVNDCLEGQLVYYNVLKIESNNIEAIKSAYKDSNLIIKK